MSPFALAAQMDALAEAAKTFISNSYGYPPETLTTPAFIVGYPTSIDEITFKRGGWKAVFPCWIVYAKGTSLTVRDALSGYLGSASVREALEGPLDVGEGSVIAAQIEPFTIGAITYVALRLDVEVLS